MTMVNVDKGTYARIKKVVDAHPRSTFPRGLTGAVDDMLEKSITAFEEKFKIENGAETPVEA